MKKRILIIEDNAEVRDNLEEILDLYGYEVATAEDGHVGAQMALRQPPDLVLCDVMMPKLDGFGVLNILSKKPQTATVPFVFLTAKTEQEDFRRSMNLGASDYITKPFYKDELLNVVETRLQKNEFLQQQVQAEATAWGAFMNETRGFEALKKLAAKQRTQTFPKRTTLFQEYANPYYLFYVKRGQVKIYKTSDCGKEYIIDIFKEGDFFGYSALLTGSAYTFSAVAMEVTEVSLIPKEDFQQLLLANKDVASRLIKMLATNVIEKEEKLVNLAYHSVRKRVADALLLLYDRSDQDSKLGIDILRDDLARLVGTAKESVIRMLAEFKEDGVIQVKDGRILVLEPKRLEAVPS